MFLFFFSTGITAAYQELDTSRVVRISCSGFPKYFAILSRIKEEVRAIGADGGKIIASHAPNVQAYFPSGNTFFRKHFKVEFKKRKDTTSDDSMLIS